MVDFAERYGRHDDLAERLRAGGPPPTGGAEELQAPMIVDTDIGGDPDDAIALAVAALRVPQLALVLTSDECGGARARFARHFLDLLGRSDVPVVSGRGLGSSRYFCVGELVPVNVSPQSSDVVSAVDAVCARSAGAVRWVGMGPVSNLADVLEARPELASRLLVTQMGGAIEYRDPGRAEHNFRLDPVAARRLITELSNPRLVISDVTFQSANEVTLESALYRGLSSTGAPDWALLLREHLGKWFAEFHPGSMQHDALALATALHHPAVASRDERVALDTAGRMSLSPDGAEVRLARKVDYAGFHWWLGKQLDWDW